VATIVAYTAIVGDYPIERDDVQCFRGEGIFARPVMEAKRYKILPHLFLPDAEVTIWVDGNISLRASAETVVDELLGDADLAVFRHPYRRTVWQEFATLKDDPRFAIPYLQKQLSTQCKAYLDAGLPAHTPLYECSILIRRNNERVNRMMEAWWAQICRWQWRDQVSLPFVLAESDVWVKAIDGNARDHHLFDHIEQWPSATSA
jgi:TOD1/MUCI70, glycosyltransferase-like domain